MVAIHPLSHAPVIKVQGPDIKPAPPPKPAVQPQTAKPAQTGGVNKTV